MRLSEFWEALDALFTPALSRTMARDVHLDRLDSQTALTALDDGVEPRDVFHALCDQAGIPVGGRDAADRQRLVPPRR